MTPDQEKKLDRLVGAVENLTTKLHGVIATARPAAGVADGAKPSKPKEYSDAEALHAAIGKDAESLYQAFKARLLAEAADDPAILEVLVRQPEIRVKVQSHTIDVDGDTLRGRLALLIADGFFDDAKESGKAFAELTRRGFKTAHPNVSRELQELARMGFMTRSNKWYQAVESMKRNIKAA